MRILITGSRDWPEINTIMNAVFDFTEKPRLPRADVTIVHGNNPNGADFFASVIAPSNQFVEEKHPAMWNIYGRSAGHIRNLEMIELGADVCLAFIKDNSPGASHCALAAKTAGIPTYIWRL